MLISDRLWLKSIYESTAEVLLADGLTEFPAIETVTDWKKLHTSIKAFIWSGMSSVCPEAYPALMEAIDRETSVVPHDGRLTPEVRKKLVSSLNRIAWAGLGGDGC